MNLEQTTSKQYNNNRIRVNDGQWMIHTDLNRPEERERGLLTLTNTRALDIKLMIGGILTWD